MQQEFWPTERQLTLPLIPPAHGRQCNDVAGDVDIWLQNAAEDRAENQRNYRR